MPGTSPRTSSTTTHAAMRTPPPAQRRRTPPPAANSSWHSRMLAAAAAMASRQRGPTTHEHVIKSVRGTQVPHIEPHHARGDEEHPMGAAVVHPAGRNK